MDILSLKQQKYKLGQKNIKNIKSSQFIILYSHYNLLFYSYSIQQQPISSPPMHNNLINTKMIEYKKRNRSTHEHSSFEPDDKENVFMQTYQQPRSGKKNQRNYLALAEKIIMKQRMKGIVADNVQYFRNILQAKDVVRPNQLTLKLPGKSVPTSYQTEFIKQRQYQSPTSSVDVQRNHFHNRSQNLSETKLPLTTTYQNEFKKFKEIKLQEKKKPKVNEILKRSITSNAPSFLDTHNSLQYRNWGTGSVMPSMKPKPQAATTDLPFKARSMYRSDFHSVILPKTQMVTQQESYPQNIDLWMGKSSYQKDFQRKRVRCHEQNYRPKQIPGATNLPFKSTTEYMRSFLESVSLGNSQIQRCKRNQVSAKKLSNMDIEKLVMDL